MVKDSEVSVRPDSVGVEFDDERLVANAGLVLIATLGRRLGIEQLVDEMVRLGERAGAAQPGRKVLTLIHAIAAGRRLDRRHRRAARRRAPRRCSATGRWRPRRSAPSCAPSPSATCASSTGCWARRSSAPGRRAPAPARSAW